MRIEGCFFLGLLIVILSWYPTISILLVRTFLFRPLPVFPISLFSYTTTAMLLVRIPLFKLKGSSLSSIKFFIDTSVGLVPFETLDLLLKPFFINRFLCFLCIFLLLVYSLSLMILLLWEPALSSGTGFVILFSPFCSVFLDQRLTFFILIDIIFSQINSI